MKKPKTKPATVGEKIARAMLPITEIERNFLTYEKRGKLARRIDAAVRRAVKRGYMSGKSDGRREGKYDMFCKDSGFEIEKLYRVKL